MRAKVLRAHDLPTSAPGLACIHAGTRMMGLGLFRSSTSSTRRRSGRSMRRAIQAPATSWQRHARTLPRRSRPPEVVMYSHNGYTMHSARPSCRSGRLPVCGLHTNALFLLAWHCSVIDRTGVRQHEWPKHGSCIANGLSSPADFFNMSLALRSLRLPPACGVLQQACNTLQLPASPCLHACYTLPLRRRCHAAAPALRGPVGSV